MTLCLNQTWTWQPSGQQISQEPSPANIFFASSFPPYTPTLQPRAVILHSRASSIMKPYKPVIWCFMACFMKVSWQAALKMVPATLTNGITTRKGALWREGSICERIAEAFMSALPQLWWVEVGLQAITDTFYVFHLLSGSHYWCLNYALIPTSCPLINYQIDPLIRLGDGQWKACGCLWRIVG